MTDREAFEAFITAPPFERSVSRFDDRGAWPGGYINYETDLAWKAWQAATANATEGVDIVADALRYRWLRRESVRFSFSAELVSLFVANQAELDGAIRTDMDRKGE